MRLLSESSKFLFDLVGDLNIFVFVLPFGKLLMVEFLLKFGLKVGHFLFLGPSLVNQLLGATGRGG